uniref:DUOXA-like protein C06E1.3 n=1 Tax=Meloidogyne incognita TaxID=6306 RepID=A0A914LLJ9_MELIC
MFLVVLINVQFTTRWISCITLMDLDSFLKIMLLGPLNKNIASSSNYYNSFAFPYTTTETTQQQAPVALINFRLLLPLLPFPLLLLVLLVILPGIREQRLISLLAIGSQLCVGTLLIGSITLPYWKLSETREILVHLQPFSKQRHLLNIGVNVGLSALNISLDYVKPFDGRLPHPRSLASLHLNEQFDLSGVSSMKTELFKAYKEGQPFPVLCVLEYFSLGQDAFSWGNQFRKAGYYTKALLWFTFGCWLLQFILLPFLPHYFAKTGLLIGFLILLSNMLYILLSPNDLHIAFPSPNGHSNFTQFRFGICFWMNVVAGFVALFFGLLFSLLQFFQLYTLSTFLDCSLDETVCPIKYKFGVRGKSEEPLKNSIKNQQQTTTDLCVGEESSLKEASSLQHSQSSGKLSIASSVSCLSVASSVGSFVNIAITNNNTNKYTKQQKQNKDENVDDEKNQKNGNKDEKNQGGMNSSNA